MDPLNLFMGFVSGILISVIAAYINHLIKIRSDRRSKILNAEYELYLKLNDLYNWYFWLATNELHKKETDQEIIKTIHEIASEIAQQLRQNEDSEFTEEFLKILYDESYITYTQRWKSMNVLSEKMGKKVIPKYHLIVKKLNESNIHLMATTNFKSKAPAMPRFLLGV